MFTLLATFAASLLLTLLLVHLAKTRWHLSADHDLSGPQKFHAVPVPRVGGLSILPAVFLGFYLLGGVVSPSQSVPLALLLLLCAAPAFVAGIVEDFTKAVRPAWRLLATAISAGLAIWLLGAQLHRTDIFFLDWFVAWPAGAALLTVFAVAGIANAVNIIDGFNGLASMCVVIMLAGVGWVSYSVGDLVLMGMCGVVIAAILGFFLWNFPHGKIFLGDGGAYCLGFFLAEIAILLLVRHDRVSPLFPLLICVYPTFETIFSIYRRRFLRDTPPSAPDGIHLHSLIYRRLNRAVHGDASVSDLTRRNSMTSPYLWVLCSLSVLPAVIFWDSTPMLGLFLGLFAVTYVWLYWRIVRFKSPRLLRLTSARARSGQDG